MRIVHCPRDTKLALRDTQGSGDRSALSLAEHAGCTDGLRYMREKRLLGRKFTPANPRPSCDMCKTFMLTVAVALSEDRPELGLWTFDIDVTNKLESVNFVPFPSQKHFFHGGKLNVASILARAEF
jgi:hypothetical protein